MQLLHSLMRLIYNYRLDNLRVLWDLLKCSRIISMFIFGINNTHLYSKMTQLLNTNWYSYSFMSLNSLTPGDRTETFEESTNNEAK